MDMQFAVRRNSDQSIEAVGSGRVERLTDTYVVFGELRKGRISFSEYLRTMRMPKESATWSIRDPLPAIMYVLMAPYLLIKRN